MTSPDLHIGQLIEKRLNEVGITKSEFSRRINKARQNINDILNRKSVDTDLLLKISEALNHDFFQYYTRSSQVKEEQLPYNTPMKEEQYKTPQQLEQELRQCQEELKAAQKEIQYLKKINTLLEDRQKGGPQSDKR